MRRALRKGEGVRRTEKNEACSSRSGTLLGGSQLSGRAGLTRRSAELDAAEMDRALVGGRRAGGMHPLGVMDMGGMRS